MKKRFLTLFITLFLIIIGLFFTGLFFVYVNFQSVTDSNNVFSYNLEVPSGTSIKTVAIELKKANIIKSEIVFYGYARFQKIAIKAGSYKILSDMNVSQIFQLLQSGVQSHIIVTIPEGLTISKIAQLLEEKNVIDSVSFLEISKNKELLEFYNIPNNSFEGFIFPDTYYFTPNMMAKKVLTMMVDNFFKNKKNK